MSLPARSLSSHSYATGWLFATSAAHAGKFLAFKEAIIVTAEERLNAALAKLFAQAQMQFGKAIKTYRFHDEETCPGCGRKVDLMQVKGENALSLNAFIYRERGVLIGYLLCSRCAKQVFRDNKRHPGQETSLHSTIEQNLVKAYLRSLN
jgi:hypothetical protein